MIKPIFSYRRVGRYMSGMKAIKVFKDLLSFLTIIPMGGKEDFIFTTAQNVWLFPVIGGFIGLLGALYFVASSYIVGFLLGLVNLLVALPRSINPSKCCSPVTTSRKATVIADGIKALKIAVGKVM